MSRHPSFIDDNVSSYPRFDFAAQDAYHGIFVQGVISIALVYPKFGTSNARVDCDSYLWGGDIDELPFDALIG